MSMLERDLRFDTKLIAIRDLGVDSIWDGRIKNLVYNTTTMEWEAQTTSGSGGGGSTTISADTSSVSTRQLAMKTVMDEYSSTVTYIGDADTGSSVASAVWRIKRLTQSGTILYVEWADGDGQFNNVWNDRTTLSYS